MDQQRLRRANLYGLLAQVEQILHEAWLAHVLEIEQSERQRPSLRRRVDGARLGIFKPLADFDYDWPKELDRQLLDELMTLSFLSDAANVIIVGPNSLGKTMLAKNILHQAILRGHTARFTLASDMLHDLAAQDSSTQLTRRLRRDTTASMLCVDEVGYLSYDSRYADLLFEVVTRRYQQRATVLTTNKPFGEWNQVFPNAACVVTLVDDSSIAPKSSTSPAPATASRKPRNVPRAASRSDQRRSQNSRTDGTERSTDRGLAARALGRLRGKSDRLPALPHRRPRATLRLRTYAP